MTDKDLQKFLGLKLEDFEIKLKDEFPNFTYRILSSDNVNYAITCDFKINRANIDLVNGKITKINIS